MSRDVHIAVTRETEIDAPYQIVADGGNDWTHFLEVHRKSHAEFRLLHKCENREIFFYKARVVYPLPFYRYYIVFREPAPEQNGYRNIYLDLKTGRVNWLDGDNRRKGDGYASTGKFIFTLPWYWRFFPGLFLRLFHRRSLAVTAEDNRVVAERMKLGGMTQPACGPKIPERYDLFDDLKAKGPPSADFHLFCSDHHDLRKPE